MWQSFIKELLKDCMVRIRIVDDVLDEEDWGVEELTIRDEVVTAQKTISKGAYRMPNMVGWESTDVIEWAHHESPFGCHPQQWNEVWIDTTNGIKPYMPVEVGHRVLGTLIATGKEILTSPVARKWVCDKSGSTLVQTKSGTIYVIVDSQKGRN